MARRSKNIASSGAIVRRERSRSWAARSACAWPAYCDGRADGRRPDWCWRSAGAHSRTPILSRSSWRNCSSTRHGTSPRLGASSAMRWACWQWLWCPTSSGKETLSGDSGGSTDDWDPTTLVPSRLLAEAVGTVRRQVGEGIGRLAAVPVFEVNVRPGGGTGRPLIADQLSLADAVAGLHLEAEQVAIKREEIVAVCHDDVVAITDQLAVEQAGAGRHYDAVISG